MSRWVRANPSLWTWKEGDSTFALSKYGPVPNRYEKWVLEMPDGKKVELLSNLDQSKQLAQLLIANPKQVTDEWKGHGRKTKGGE